MAKVSIMSANGHPAHSNSKEFLLLSREDIARLPRYGISGMLSESEPGVNEPVAYGSTAIVKEDGEIYTYLLFPDNEWTEL